MRQPSRPARLIPSPCRRAGNAPPERRERREACWTDDVAWTLFPVEGTTERNLPEIPGDMEPGFLARRQSPGDAGELDGTATNLIFIRPG